MNPVLLLRYDVEGGGENVSGFLEKAVGIHRKDSIPVGFFCVASEIEARPSEFKDFAVELKGDELFNIHDHSYSRVPLLYENGPSVSEIDDDYARSLEVFERIMGFRPEGTSLCASTTAGKGLPGFDATAKTRDELEVLAKHGFKMTTCALAGHVRMHEFVSYAKLGHPEIMGFPSGNGDKNWLLNPTAEKPLDALFQVMEKAFFEGKHLGIVLHDWVTWNHAPDKEFSHIRRIADRARDLGFRMATHSACLRETELWAENAD